MEEDAPANATLYLGEDAVQIAKAMGFEKVKKSAASAEVAVTDQATVFQLFTGYESAALEICPEDKITLMDDCNDDPQSETIVTELNLKDNSIKKYRVTWEDAADKTTAHASAIVDFDAPADRARLQTMVAAVRPWRKDLQ